MGAASSVIVGDLLLEYHHGEQRVKFAGGLLGHWAVWTHRAVQLLDDIQAGRDASALDLAITDCNAAFFDAANGFWRKTGHAYF